MQVYSRILVAIDCSPVDDAIVEHVGRLACQNGAAVVLLHVVHSHTLDQDRVLRAKAEAALEDYRRRLDCQGITVSLVIRTGDPEREILKELEDPAYDLMAMATHGHTLVGDLLFGSVSRTLKHRIRIPLLLLKADPERRS